jgi:hypothetical protein
MNMANKAIQNSDAKKHESKKGKKKERVKMEDNLLLYAE